MNYGDPNPVFAASGATALMPTRNFAQERADAAAELQLVQMDAQQARLSADEKRLAKERIDNELSRIDNAALLDQDKVRLNLAITDPSRQAMEKELTDTYGGDIGRFERERGSYWTKRIGKAMVSSPLYQKSLRNMANHSLYETAKKKGQLIAGDYDGALIKFNQGLIDELPDVNSYDSPKNLWDHFEQNYHPAGKYGKMTRDQKGREVYTSYEVTGQDLLNQLMNQGLTPSQAQDYLGRLNYKGGRSWKTEWESPWDQDQRQRQAAHQRAVEQQGWAQIGISRDRLAIDKQQAGLEDDLKRAQIDKTNAEAAAKRDQHQQTTTVNSELYHLDMNKAQQFTNAAGKPLFTVIGTERHKVYEKPFVSGGDIARNIIDGAGIDPNPISSPVKPGEPDQGHYYQSNIKRVVDSNGQVWTTNKGGHRFKNVDTSKLVYITKGQTSAAGLPIYVPHFRAEVELGIGDDKEYREVLVPVPDTPLQRANNARVGAFDSDERRAQGAMQAGIQTTPYQPSSPRRGDRLDEMIRNF